MSKVILLSLTIHYQNNKYLEFNKGKVLFDCNWISKHGLFWLRKKANIVDLFMV